MNNIETRLKDYKKQLLTYSEALWLLRKEGVSPSEVKAQTSYKWQDKEIINNNFTMRDEWDARVLPPELRDGIRIGSRLGWGIILCLIIMISSVKYLPSQSALQTAAILVGGLSGIGLCIYGGFIHKLSVFLPRWGGREFAVNGTAALLASYFAILIAIGVVILLVNIH